MLKWNRKQIRIFAKKRNPARDEAGFLYQTMRLGGTQGLPVGEDRIYIQSACLSQMTKQKDHRFGEDGVRISGFSFLILEGGATGDAPLTMNTTKTIRVRFTEPVILVDLSIPYLSDFVNTFFEIFSTFLIFLKRKKEKEKCPP